METGRENVLVQLRKGVIEYCVLSQLCREPSYGLKLASDLARHSSLFASEGTIYPLLVRLRKRGLVETTWQESATGPPRRYYRVTPAGEEALNAFRAAWEPFASETSQLLKEPST
ncbi:PadR family transcriptional regulator PadR [Arthrobacter sp. UYP6]|uniref:PadR family transcriptional regulator n=1 Tax=Arthrobacter sp. UYP6 TaxID=1756378 RepID=UPI0033993B35